MQLCDIFLGLGEERFEPTLRSVSMGKLKTFQLFDRFKTRLHLTKLNAETLRKAAPRVWVRVVAREDDVATDIGQAVLVSHLDMIKAVLDHLGVPHEDGFFAKDAEVVEYLKDGWQQAVWDKFHTTLPAAPLLFYINHLAWEIAKAEAVFIPAA